MSTINISLPQTQVGLVDEMTSRFGFANRSEFMRSLLRLVARQPQMVAEAAVFPFVAPKERSTKKIIGEFAKTKKYSTAFLKDLRAGLAQSDYFKD